MQILRKLLRLVLRLIIVFFLISIFSVITFKFINPPVTPFMLYKYFGNESSYFNKEWKSLEEISPYLPLSVIASEDQLFFEHNGFDVEAIKEAIAYNKNNKRIRGASTISQQTAKNVFLIPHRSYIRKGLEVYLTFLIELIWGKERIIEVYLNVIEQGENIYGVEAAAQKFFNKSAENVTKSEAALMAVVLPNPIKFDLARPSGYMINRKNWVLRQMNNLGGVSYVERIYEE